MATETRANYRLGALYSLTTGLLLAMQAPFSALAAKSLSSALFVCFTQVALLASVPLLIRRDDSRRDFAAVLLDVGNIGKLAALFLIGVAGLLLYNIGLTGANPIITAAIMNLSPFWAALVAFLVSRKSIPTSPLIFWGCFIVAFIGAMTIAWSQLDNAHHPISVDSLSDILHSKWIYAIPMPIFFALSGSLVFKWFREFDESAVIAANFLISALLLIPTTVIIALANASNMKDRPETAILLLLVGTLASSAAGRVFYQVALTTTRNDNGFVTMFFLMVPGIASLICIPLSWWIPELRVVSSLMFFLGLALVMLPLAVFSLKSSSGGLAEPERGGGAVGSGAVLR